jgi:CheY-like chemotaxis protein
MYCPDAAGWGGRTGALSWLEKEQVGIMTGNDSSLTRFSTRPATLARNAAMAVTNRSSILAVDDEATARAVIEDVLSREGYHVRTVSSYQGWEDAWSSDGSPDLVILDVNLSERRGGYEILRTMRKQNKTIPVLMLSARNTAADTAFARASGASGFVSKVEGEFDHPERGLVAAVRRLLAS